MRATNEVMDIKADGACKHGQQLRSDRETILERIAGYHMNIDGCTQEMNKRLGIEAKLYLRKLMQR